MHQIYQAQILSTRPRYQVPSTGYQVPNPDPSSKPRPRLPSTKHTSLKPTRLLPPRKIHWYLVKFSYLISGPQVPSGPDQIPHSEVFARDLRWLGTGGGTFQSCPNLSEAGDSQIPPKGWSLRNPSERLVAEKSLRELGDSQIPPRGCGSEMKLV